MVSSTHNMYIQGYTGRATLSPRTTTQGSSQRPGQHLYSRERWTKRGQRPSYEKLASPRGARGAADGVSWGGGQTRRQRGAAEQCVNRVWCAELVSDVKT